MPCCYHFLFVIARQSRKIIYYQGHNITLLTFLNLMFRHYISLRMRGKWRMETFEVVKVLGKCLVITPQTLIFDVTISKSIGAMY